MIVCYLLFDALSLSDYMLYVVFAHSSLTHHSFVC